MKSCVTLFRYSKLKIQPRVFIFALVLQFATLAVFAQYSKLLDFAGGTEARDPIGVLITDGIYMYGISFNGGTSDTGTIYKIKQDGTGYLKIHDFTGTNGKNPEGSLYYDGTFLYGMTYYGGTNDMGVIYKIMPDGSNYQKLLDFDGTNGKGPYGTFVSDGTYLYAMTWQGGANDLGKIFRILPDGTGYQSLMDFAGASNGSLPAATLYINGSRLFGMTSAGGANGVGTVFGINTNGAGYTKLHDFAAGANGREPYGALISDGTYLYGLTYFGGANDLGTAFRLMPDGTNFSKLMDFAVISTGSHPYTNLTLSGSYLYGLAPEGGGFSASNKGTLFKVKTDGTGLTKLLNFLGASNGSTPNGSLLSIGPYLYGTTSAGGASGNGTLFKYEIYEPFTKLLDFTGPVNGLVPYGSLYSDGTFLYGMTEEGGVNNLGTIFKVKPDGTEYSKLLDFAGATNGSGPFGSLISDGIFLYGMTYSGGTSNVGTIFKIMPDGTGYMKLHEFSALANGVYPESDLYYVGGWLYGMTPSGGANNRGTFFKIMPDGTGYQKLSDFGAPFDGSGPRSSLYYDGTFFYGTTNGGGSAGRGTIFKIKPDGTNLTKLLDFGIGTDGRFPEGSFTSDGTYLYGTTSQGGTNNYGSLFKIKPDGTDFATILSFDNNIYGSSPQGTPLLVGEFLYAMAYVGGPNFEGTIFKIKTDGTNFKTVHEFSGITSGSYPIGNSLITDGTYFYGMTNNGGLNEGTVFRLRDIPENSTILNFTGTATGNYPTYTRLTCDGTSLYGMTSRGGTNDEGVVFKVNQDGSSFNKLYDFGPAPDGERPHGSLYNDGTFLYGMTSSGGSSFLNNQGTIFKIKPDGTSYLKIFNFDGTATGKNPSGTLISDGVFLYGVTIRGGLSNSGTIFKILPDGSGFVKLHDFPATDGSYGDLTLIGTTLYGATLQGGAVDEGTIFKMETNGTGYTTLHEFNSFEGSLPLFSGALEYDGTYLYGMTEIGGTSDDGVVFKIKPDGTGYENLHNFSLPSGTIPLGALELVGSTLYGLTYQGGTADLGTLFKINTDGSGYQTLMDFDGIANGYEVLGTLCYCNNALYGMTTSGGANDLGTIFKYIIPPATPGIPTVSGFSPASGPIGTTVTITGTNFSATPANNTVQFNGTTAVVTASTSTSISTTVPIGATTGTITVTVAGNTATSATNFTVTVSSVITITTQPSDFIACVGQTATFITAATGTTNITYQWQFSIDGIAPFADITNGGGYSNATTATLSVNTTANFGLGRYRCRINGDFAIEVITNDEGLFINPISTAPTVVGANRCGAGSVTLTASGGTNGQYKWYTTATGGTAIAGETSGNYVTPSITSTTSYYVSLNTNGCESTRTLVTATLTITPAPTATGASGCPASAVTLVASGGTNGQYNWYTVATGGTAITGATNNTYQISSLTVTSTFYVSLTISGCESTRTAVTSTLLATGCAPVITTQALTTQVEGKIEINLQSLITTPGTLDPNSIKIVTQPASGAIASITNFVLTIDYKDKPFSGRESVTIEACNTNGLCAQQTFNIEVVGEVIVYNALSPNGDGKNEIFFIQYIDLLPETQNNKVTIYNRWGSKVFEVSNYNNITNVFRGLNDGGNELPSGTYFYKIEFNSGRKGETGYLTLKK